MTERHLRIFLAVCEEMNMTRAAERLYLSQPAVSQAIRELETFYQTPLFERNPKKLTITDAGASLRTYAENILRLFSDAQAQLASNTVPVIHTGAILSVATGLLTGYIDEFQKDWPRTRVQVRVCGSAKLIELMRQDKLDIALIEDTILPEDMEHESFYNDRLVIVTAPEDPLAGQETPFYELMRRDFLLRESGAGVRDLFERLMFERNLHVEPLWESCSTTSLVEAAHAGYGVSVQPYLLVRKYLDSGYLAEIPVTDLQLSRNLNIVWRKGRSLSPVTQAFIGIIRQQIQR